MSFSENPYKHIHLQHDGEFVWWHCDSCGADSCNARPPKLWSMSILMDINEIRDNFEQHIKESHKRIPEDFEDWYY